MLRKTKTNDAPVAITLLSGELANINRSLDILQAVSDQGIGNDALIELAANRIAGATAARKRIKAINAAMAGRSLAEIRKSSGPMEALINSHKISTEELMAVMDIEKAMMALAGAGMIKPMSIELKSAGKKRDWSRMTSDAVQNYIAWANFWSARRTYGDRTAEIVVRVVIHGQSFREIAQDVGKDRETCPRIAVRGLRDYAARSGWVARRVAQQWMREALTSFKGTPLGELGLAIDRAKKLPHERAGTPPAAKWQPWIRQNVAAGTCPTQKCEGAPVGFPESWRG